MNMALSAEVLAAITALRKENEDLVTAKVRKIYKAKYGEETLAVGENTIAFPIEDDTAYVSADDYEIRIHEAIDANGIDVSGSIIITKEILGFKADSLRESTLKWEAFLKTPDFEFFTQ